LKTHQGAAPYYALALRISATGNSSNLSATRQVAEIFGLILVLEVCPKLARWKGASIGIPQFVPENGG
jgi:hypothetical protein